MQTSDGEGEAVVCSLDFKQICLQLMVFCQFVLRHVDPVVVFIDHVTKQRNESIVCCSLPSLS